MIRWKEYVPYVVLILAAVFLFSHFGTILVAGLTAFAVVLFMNNRKKRRSNARRR